MGAKVKCGLSLFGLITFLHVLAISNHGAIFAFNVYMLLLAGCGLTGFFMFLAGASSLLAGGKNKEMAGRFGVALVICFVAIGCTYWFDLS